MLNLALLAALAFQEPLLLAHDGERFTVAESVRSGAPTPLAYVTLSERVPRVVPGGRGLGVRLEGRAPRSGVHVRAHAVSHARDERVVRTVAGLFIVSAPMEHPPVEECWPELARQDAVAALPAKGELSFASPTEIAESTRFVLFGLEGKAPVELSVDTGEEFVLHPGPFDASLLPASSKQLKLGEARLDQVQLAEVRPLEARAWQPLSVRRYNFARDVGGAGHPWSRHGFGPVHRLWSDPDRALPADRIESGRELPVEGFELSPRGVLEVWFAAPPTPVAGSSWTILIEVESEVPAGPTPAEASHGSGVPRTPTPPGATQARDHAPERASRQSLFRDGTEELGLAHSHLEGAREQLDIRPTMGPGAAWGDVDGDGFVDLYVVQGAGRFAGDALPNRLFKNEGGRFTDVTRTSGAGDTGAGMGALFFDADGDGDLDLYVANRGADVFYINDGTGHFTDVSDAVGVGGELWSAGIAAADADGDGDLDLYVTSYLEYDESLMPAPEELASYGREDPVAMLPFAFPGQRNVFLRNRSEEGRLYFEDATEELGLLDVQGRGMQPLFWDFDADGDQDLYVANDVSFNVLFRNEGDGTFKDVSFATGMDDPRGGMGVAVGDVESDADEDLFLTNWELEANALYRNNLLSHASQRSRVATFRDVTVDAGFGPFAVGYTSWGAELLDLELDGDLDLVVANGYTSPDYESTGICIGQPNHVYENDGDGHFREVSRELSPLFAEELASRSLSACDFDRDGDLDLLFTTNNGPVRLFVNELPRAGRWLVVRPRGNEAYPNVVGTCVTLEVEGRKLTRVLRAGTSYLAGAPRELHFGLGSGEMPTALHVRWPDGAEETRALEGVDRYMALER